MQEHAIADDQSHYEISLTAGQAFVAFVLLLLSLAAAFAFGLMIGKGQADDRLVVQKAATPIVTEAALTPKKNEGRIVELGVEADDFKESEEPATETAADAAVTATVVEEAPVPTGETPAGQPAGPALSRAEGTPAVRETPVVQQPAPTQRVTTYAQLLSTGDQKTAESLAARLIDRGFTAAYVERGATDKGPIYRVRVKFDSEADARAAEAKLREFSKEVWITTK